MSLKGVELQIAIPKTFEAGKAADQAQQQVLANQAHANEALKKDIERKQLAVNMSEQTDEISNDLESATEDAMAQQQSKKKNKKAQQHKKAKHPFKGNFVDFSG